MLAHGIVMHSWKIGKFLSATSGYVRLVCKLKHRRVHQNVFGANTRASGSTRTVCGSFYMWAANTTVNTVSLTFVPFLNNGRVPDTVTVKDLPNLKIVERKEGILLRIGWLLWDSVHTFLRFLQLSCIFLPLFLVYPISRISSPLSSMWYRCLLLGIEISGPIIIKLGQWASTRRDLFSEELCVFLSKLQRRVRPHSWYFTLKSLECAFGPSWQDIFVKIDNDGAPIGSGCCAQVYKAWIVKDPTCSCVPSADVGSSRSLFRFEVLEMLGLGRFCGKYKKLAESKHEKKQLMPVAVKVLHPQMEVRLRQDLFILKACASAVTWLIPSLKWLSLRECVDEFAQVMESQVNFRTEALNLEMFAENFRGSRNVKFPHPVWPLIRPYILVESFEEGQHIESFMRPHESECVKKQLADVGVNAVLKMVFQDNFIHGDLHPGNMLVQIHEPSAAADQGLTFPFWKTKELPFSLVILDCGIVSALDARGRTCLRDVFAAVANIDVDVSVLMRSLFSAMISHKVKVDGSFSSVILAIMVVEGLGRSLDPTIDVVEKAKPFLFTQNL